MSLVQFVLIADILAFFACAVNVVIQKDVTLRFICMAAAMAWLGAIYNLSEHL